MLADVVTRQGDGVVSVESGHGHVALLDRVGRRDDPALTIAHRLPHTRAQSAIVPTCCDDIADHHPRISDWRQCPLVELTGVAQLEEHAAPHHGLELVWVTDERESPLSLLGVGDEA